MIKKIFALFAIFSFLTVSAAVPQQNLKNAVNNFNYALTVEWDQKDTGFYDQTVKNFKDTILKFSKDGMTNKEIITSVLSSIKDRRLAQDVLQQIEIINTEEMTAEETIEFVSDKISATQTEGSQFIGRTTFVKHLLILGIVAAIVTAFHCDNDWFSNDRCWDTQDSI